MATRSKAKGKAREVSQPIAEGSTRPGPLTRLMAQGMSQATQNPFTRSTSVPADTSRLVATSPFIRMEQQAPQEPFRQRSREPTEPLRDILGGGLQSGERTDRQSVFPTILQPRPLVPVLSPIQLATPRPPSPDNSPSSSEYEPTPVLPYATVSAIDTPIPAQSSMSAAPVFPIHQGRAVHSRRRASGAPIGVPKGRFSAPSPVAPTHGRPYGFPPPPPPPGYTGGGPGGPPGGFPPPPPPPGNTFLTGQPYYIYYSQNQDEGARFKEPDVFTGKDPAKLPPFITQCTHWFMAKPRKFPTERDKVLFAASYLRDLANQWWMPLLIQQPSPPLLDDWATFTDELFQMFGNQHLQTSSQNAILSMKMKDDARVPEYLVRFNSHAVYTGWNDSALANHFYRGLPQRLKERFAYQHRPQAFVDMRRMALDFDQMYWEYQEELGNKPKPSAQSEQGKGKKGKSSSDNAHNSSQQNQES